MHTVPYATFVEVLSGAEQEYGPRLVADIACAKTIGDFDVVGYLFMNAPTLWSGLEAVRDWLPVINSRSKIQLLRTDRFVTWKYTTAGISADRNAIAAEMAIAEQVQGIRKYIGQKSWWPAAVYFEHAPRGNARFLGSLLGKGIHFNQPISGIKIQQEILSYSCPKADNELFGILTKRCVAGQAYSDDIVSAVTRLVSDGVRNGRLGAEEIAFELAMSKRTLYRRLKEAGSSLGEIRQATLIPIAKEYLSQNLSLSTIGYRLGYSDCRSFARAFKRGTGLAPAEYRKRIASIAPIPVPCGKVARSKGGTHEELDVLAGSVLRA